LLADSHTLFLPLDPFTTPSPAFFHSPALSATVFFLTLEFKFSIQLSPPSTYVPCLFLVSSPGRFGHKNLDTKINPGLNVFAFFPLSRLPNNYWVSGSERWAFIAFISVHWHPFEAECRA